MDFPTVEVDAGGSSLGALSACMGNFPYRQKDFSSWTWITSMLVQFISLIEPWAENMKGSSIRVSPIEVQLQC